MSSSNGSWERIPICPQRSCASEFRLSSIVGYPIVPTRILMLCTVCMQYYTRFSGVGCQKKQSCPTRRLKYRRNCHGGSDCDYDRRRENDPFVTSFLPRLPVVLFSDTPLCCCSCSFSHFFRTAPLCSCSYSGSCSFGAGCCSCSCFLVGPLFPSFSLVSWLWSFFWFLGFCSSSRGA